ncbi:MAG: YbjN domain-containing protein [Actinomycetaceae bacterium]|nr:YbjN domain-containing protein [Actinomycetaceae bacterium]
MPDHHTPTLITRDRLENLCIQQGWHYFIDSQGQLGSRWEDHTFFFIVSGNAPEQRLEVWGQYMTWIDLEHLDTVRDIIDESLRNRPWPNAFHSIDDAGHLRVHANLPIPYSGGATDVQLLQHIDCALGTTLSLFDQITQAIR